MNNKENNPVIDNNQENEKTFEELNSFTNEKTLEELNNLDNFTVDNLELPNLNAGEPSLDDGTKRRAIMKPIIKDGKIILPIGAIIKAEVITNKNPDSKGFFKGIQKSKLQVTIEEKQTCENETPSQLTTTVEPTAKDIMWDGKNMTPIYIELSLKKIRELTVVALGITDTQLSNVAKESKKIANTKAFNMGYIVKENGTYKLSQETSNVEAIYQHLIFEENFKGYANLITLHIKDNDGKLKYCRWHVVVDERLGKFDLTKYVPMCEKYIEGYKPTLEISSKLTYKIESQKANMNTNPVIPDIIIPENNDGEMWK